VTKSVVQIARDQRYVLLLEKVQGNKALTPGEVRELEGYEAERRGPAADEAPASDAQDQARVQQRRQAVPKRGPAPPKAGKRVAQRRPALPGLTPARVRALALEFADMTAADAHLGRRYDLVALLAEYPELEGAWRRGRLLRNIRRLAATGTTIHEAAYHLNLPADELQRLVTSDIEVANHWNEARLATAVALKEQWLEKAKEGNARAIAQVQVALQNEIAHAAMDIHTVPEAKMTEIIGVSRMTLNRWLREQKMPRNAGDNTYDLPAVWSWFEGFVKRRATGVPAEKGPSALEQQRLLDLEVRRGQLVDQGAVESGWAVRARALASILERIPDQYAAAAAGKTKQQLQPMFKSLCDDIRREYVTALDAETGKD